MRTLIAWLFLATSVLSAQTGIFTPDYYFSPQLKAYLALSDDQVARMATTKSQIASLQLPKLQRQGQLQLEISQETAKTAPDPAALGTRYAELESIRRALDTLQNNTVNQLQMILGADQKVKLAALQQALLLYSTACDAVAQNLLNAPQTRFPTPQIPVNRLSPSYVSALISVTSLGGCTGGPSLVLTPGGSLATQP
jgi:hypothetical protein